MPSYLLITNPFSGHGFREKHIDKAVALFSARGARVEVVRTRGPGDAYRAVAAMTGGYKAIVVAGGDGTINEVINALEGRRIPIGIVPRGTANVLAHELEIPRNSRRAIDIIVQGKELLLDVGMAGERRFMLLASAGYDAQVVAEVHRGRTRPLNYAAFALPIWRMFKKGKFPEITVEIHGREYVCRHVVVANVPRSGGPLCPVPHAIYNDGQFDVVMYLRGGRWNMLRYGMLAIRRSDKAADDIIRMRCDHVVLSSQEPVPFQCDGDPVGVLPQTLDIKPDNAAFLVP
ncbi:MAG: diacylglycerol kinase family lipid kinase [Planctomycetes bacterium]|nr:diacylglycerol kinase family lipid kinase [Planctomycetota bacterium]